MKSDEEKPRIDAHARFVIADVCRSMGVPLLENVLREEMPAPIPGAQIIVTVQHVLPPPATPEVAA